MIFYPITLTGLGSQGELELAGWIPRGKCRITGGDWAGQ